MPEVDWSPVREFWLAAGRGEFVIPRCQACERYVWYPEEACPHCGGSEMPWTAMSGRGQLFSWSEVRHPLYPPYANELPYVSGLIALAEDPRVRYVTRIVDCEASELQIEMSMEVVFRELSFAGIEGAVEAPVFRPVGGAR
jgi:uncharacterized OB-fold protein